MMSVARRGGFLALAFHPIDEFIFHCYQRRVVVNVPKERKSPNY